MKLSSSVLKLPFVGPSYATRLKKLNIETVEDLLLHVPTRYIDYRHHAKIISSEVGVTVTITGEVTAIKNQYTRHGKKLQFAKVSDNTGELDVVWFNQPYLTRSIHIGDKVALSGKVDNFNNKKALISPEYEILHEGSNPLHTGRLVPIYPATTKLSSKWLRGRIATAYQLSAMWLEEFLPDADLKKYKLLEYQNSVRSIHFPTDFDESSVGKKRLAFNELLFLQLKNKLRKKDWEENKVVHILSIKSEMLKNFVYNLDFELTNSQENSIREIFDDLKSNLPMNRLLEGDVGSGKTVVAAAAAFASFVNGFQTVFMAPTQILAQQHFNTLKQLFNNYKVRVALVTSAGIKSDIGKSDIFIGTHALIHNKVSFDKVALVIIDEQHRFGVEQRAHLIKKSKSGNFAPHVLTMTATPIPRTIALTVYGDLNLSTLKELPKGRIPIVTWIVPETKRPGAYAWIKDQLNQKGVQVFVICPLIEESDKESMQQIKAATQEFANLKKIFNKQKLGLLHGRMKTKEKDKILEQFKKGKIDILVSTPVVEVGIDIPNATIMAIEGAERFGLAQLHQLRGRVGRSDKKSYCLLFSGTRASKPSPRLNAMTKTSNGFELAELDLKLRGPGEVYGIRQHGFTELKIASWQDSDLIKSAKTLANSIFNNLDSYPKVKKILKRGSIVMN